MARIKPSVIVSDIRGKIGGSVFQSSNAGLVLKSNNKKVNKNSIAQSFARNIAAFIQNSWREIGQADRDIWSAFSTFAKVQHRNSSQYFLNGQQAFLKANAIRLQYDQGILNPPEFSKCVTLSVNFSIALNGANLELTSSRLIDSLVEFVVCFASVPVPASINNPGSRLKLLVFVTATDTVFNLNAAYTSVFGRTPVAGETIFIRAFVANKLTGLFTIAETIKQTL